MAISIDDRQFVDSMLPNIHVKTITLESFEDNKLSLRLDMMVQERLEDELSSLWFENEDFLSALSIMIVLSKTDYTADPVAFAKQFPNLLKGMSLDPSTAEVTILKFKDFVSFSENSLLEELQTHYEHTDSDGNTVYDISFDKTFIIEQLSHLTCFFVPILDLTAFSDMVDVAPGSSKIIGNMAVEHVFNNGVLVDERKVFKTLEGKIWQGPTHIMPNAEIHTGFSHSNNSVLLTVESAPNTNKVQDFRLRQQEVEAVKIDLDFVEKEIFVDNPIKLNTEDIEKKESYFSDFFASRTNDGQVNFLFGFNYEKACRNNSRFGSLMERSGEIKDEILAMSQLTSLTVSRRRVTDIQNQNRIDTPVKNEPFEKNEKYQEIITVDTPASQGALFGNTDDGSLRELIIDLDPQNQKERIKFFTGNDKNIASSEKGFYQYDVRAEIVDGSKKVLKDKLEILLAARDTLQEYYVVATGYAPGTPKKLNFHLKSRRFRPEFIEKMSSFSKQGAAIANYVKVLGLLGNRNSWSMYALGTFFLNLIKPETGSPEGISIAIKSVSDLASRLTELLEMEASDKGTKSSYSQTPKNSFTIEKKFYSTVDNNAPKSLGINYISNYMKFNGLASITAPDYKTRVKKEFAKYYKTPPTTHTAYLSPIEIDLPGQPKPTKINLVAPAQKKKYGPTSAYLTTNQTTGYVLKPIDYTRETLGKKNIKITPHISSLGLSTTTLSTLLGSIVDSDTVGREPDLDSAAYLKSIKEKEYKPLFASLTQESDHNLPESIEFFKVSPLTSAIGKTGVLAFPTQLQSLIDASSANLAKKDWHADPKDLFSNSEQFPALLLNYLLLVEVEYLVGFEMTKNDKTSLGEPVWDRLTMPVFDSLDTRALCRIKKYSNNEIGMKYAKVSAPINNEHFLLEKS